MRYPGKFDVIVIGGGHAGTEAALASARSGARTLLLTHSIETVGAMSCNPAIGGIGKGHLVREIDALGGVMARAADAAGIQLRTLNARKGPAVRATRAQCDRNLYRAFIRKTVEAQAGLSLFQAAVDDITLEGERVVGCRTAMGLEFRADAVVLTTGTFLGGKIHGRSARRRTRRRPALEDPGGPPARIAFYRRAIEDRYTAAYRRQDGRFQRARTAARGQSQAGVLVHRQPRGSSRAAVLLDHAYLREDS